MDCTICGRKDLNEKELEVHIKVFHRQSKKKESKTANGMCPDCGSTLWFQEGCNSCSNPSCGYSHC